MRATQKTPPLNIQATRIPQLNGPFARVAGAQDLRTRRAMTIEIAKIKAA
jgi:hypothetical protein